MVLTPSSILILVLVPLVGFLAAKWLFQKDTEVENRRRGAAKLAAVLQTYGLKKTPEFLIDYSVSVHFPEGVDGWQVGWGRVGFESARRHGGARDGAAVTA